MGGDWHRRVIALSAVCIIGAACASAGEDATPATGAAPTTTLNAATALPTTPPTAASSTTESPNTRPPDPDDPYAQPGWVTVENRRPGSADWRLAGEPPNPVRDTPLAWIEGFADTTSAQHGQTVTLFVDTPAATFTAVAYRMGWYGGVQAREVWRSPATPGSRQPGATFDTRTGLSEAPWTASLTVEITDDWPPGAYLLKLMSDAGGGHFVPLTVRHDAAAADLLFMSAVTTWQAYNPWGGCTLYECFAPRTKFRGEVVSFDRPYAHSYGQGAADFPTHELPLISFIEEHGFDVAYVTNVDIHREPQLATSRTAVVSTGHDEYYSWAMREALVEALDTGRNIAFFGANAVYRNIRFEPGATGVADRRFANFRANDPGAGGDPHLVTVNWRESPLRRPEAEIVGIQYGCAEVHADMRLVNTGSWFYAGTGATEGQRLDNLVGVEFDELAPSSQTPAGLEVLAASPLHCRELTYQQVTAYHSRPSGAAVFAAGTINWNCGLDGSCPGIQRFEVVRGVTLNVLQAFVAGPAGTTHPASGNAGHYRVRVHEPVDPPRPPRTPRSTTTTTEEPPPPTDPEPTNPPPTDPPPTQPPPTDPPPPPPTAALPDQRRGLPD
ncbi:MAG: hypothetical protein Q7V88_19210 [Actinomycetota bacterium]|nr:hypothetical protein [Actinomycetota bacterium]